MGRKRRWYMSNATHLSLRFQLLRLSAPAVLIIGYFGFPNPAISQSAGSTQMPSRAPIMNTYRDPQIAVQEELAAARNARTVEAYDLFIARHGENTLADVARRERSALVQDHK